MRRQQALARADSVLNGQGGPPSCDVERWFAVGDPQTSFDRFAALLEHHGLLGDGGWLRPDVGLVSMGDHFDYGSADPLEVVGREGQRILGWLAAHPRAQVRLLLGNHDAARVIEFGACSDARFDAMRAEVRGLAPAQEAAFALRHEIASAGLVRRDYAPWNEAQRAQVQRLLLDGRYELAVQAEHEGRALLLSHAGVTVRELSMLGLAMDAGAERVCRALAAHLTNCVARVAEGWDRAEALPLALGPLHVSPVPGREAGGLLAHRPANPSRPGAQDRAWEWDPERPRRFPVERLPTHFDQAVGHTGRSTIERELAPWSAAVAPDPGPLHTLHFGDGVPLVERGIAPPRAGQARLLFLDPSLSKLADPTAAELMPIDVVAERPA
jgi:hypothetical protein